SLSLLKIDGTITQDIYLTDYKQFDYQYINNSVRADKKQTSGSSESTRKVPLISYDGMYIDYKRDLLDKSDGLSTDIGITILNRIRLKGYGELWLNGIKPNSSGIKVGYRLF